jgi:hypothetical protein
MSDLPFSTVYRAAHISYCADGPHVVVHIGCITSCGEWVQVGGVRYPLGPSWHLRRCDAEASAAGDIRTHAMRCLDYADGLRRRAAT